MANMEAILRDEYLRGKIDACSEITDRAMNDSDVWGWVETVEAEAIREQYELRLAHSTD